MTLPDPVVTNNGADPSKVARLKSDAIQYVRQAIQHNDLPVADYLLDLIAADTRDR